jgi:hypothetical protein
MAKIEGSSSNNARVDFENLGVVESRQLLNLRDRIASKRGTIEHSEKAVKTWEDALAPIDNQVTQGFQDPTSKKSANQFKTVL